MLPAEPRPADGRAWTSRPSVSAVLAAGWPPNSRCRPPPPLAVIGIAERAIKGLVLGLSLKNASQLVLPYDTYHITLSDFALRPPMSGYNGWESTHKHEHSSLQ